MNTLTDSSSVFVYYLLLLGYYWVAFLSVIQRVKGMVSSLCRMKRLGYLSRDQRPKWQS